MRRIFLFRHSLPDFPGGVRRCIGSGTDLGLGAAGVSLAASCAPALDGLALSGFYASPLKRARETAEAMSAGRFSVTVRPGLEEAHYGVWEGLPFSEIRERWPELYAAREHDKSLSPPGAEGYEKAVARFEETLRALLAATEGDIAIVAHAGVNRALICKLTGLPLARLFEVPQDYCAVNVLTWEEGVLAVSAAGLPPEAVPDGETVEALWRESGTPEHVRAHCELVRDTALELATRLGEAGTAVNLDLLAAAATLHDLDRLSPRHAHVTAEKLRTMGYLRLGAVIEPHHGGLLRAELDEAALLFLADKYCRGTELVSLEDRFDASAEKCVTGEAKRAHAARYAEAKKTEQAYKDAIGGRSRA